MTITAGMVKELREQTGVGMMDCKKALEENSGDLEKAIVWLRERGLSRAAKKAGRIAAEGAVEVEITPDHTAGIVLEVNCETDFVSKNDEFRAFTSELAKLALTARPKTLDQLTALTLANGKTASERLTELIAKIGENMDIRRFKIVETKNGLVGGYSHMGGRIGSLVAIEGGKGGDVGELTRDLAMHVAAVAPRYLVSSEVDTTELDQEREIARKKLQEEKKPDNLIEKILEGQMQKFYKEICLVDQAFVKDPNITVTKHVKQVGANLSLTGFARFALGEGIEKKTEDFAAEVAAQIRQ